MADADLLFQTPATGSADLVFGGSDPVGPVRVDIAITGSFEPLTVSAGVAMVADVAITGSFEPLTVSASAEYRSNTQRPTVAATRSSHQVAQPTSTGAEHRQHDATASPHGWEAFWQRATGLTPGVEHRQAGTLKPLRVSTAAQHQDAAPMRDSKVFAHQVADRSVRKLLASAFENAARVSDDTLFKHQDGDRTKRVSRLAPWKRPRHITTHRWSGFQPAAVFLFGVGSRYQEGVPPPPGVSSLPPEPPGPTPCYTPNPHLLFSFPPFIGGNLIFQCGDYTPGPQPGETIVVPVRRFYMVVNSVSLVRLPSGVDLPAYAFSMTLDSGSWTWSWSATLDKSAGPHVVREPGAPPIEVLAEVNGEPYRLMIDRVGRSKEFPAGRITVRGRGRAAELDAPWAPVMSFGNSAIRTAQQLTSDVLMFNGVPIGWDIDWGVEDWLVPAGAWQFQGAYIAAVNDIAGAVGGYVQPHPTDKVLRVLPMYPAAPWEWGDLTPDVLLPASAVRVEDTEWIDKPAYNGVFVGGVAAGVFGPVTRNGTDGTLLAPQVTHALITDEVAHRQRGLAVLSDTGSQAMVQLTLQVLPETGIIMPGTLLEYVSDDGPAVGLSRSTAVNWSRPRLRQTIEVETHRE